jgi:apolipoprotein D and lipocalin family protein
MGAGESFLITIAVLLGIVVLGGLVFLGLFFAQSQNSKQALADALATQSNLLTSDVVDLEKYAGKWFEQARLPVPFEGEECKCVTAEYTINNENGTVDVLNTCAGVDGKAIETAKGVARPVENTQNRALRVSFGPAFLGDAIAGDYWIFFVDDQYETAIVGSPDFETMWILSREPVLDTDQLQQLIAVAQQKGFDTSKLIFRSPNCAV